MKEKQLEKMKSLKEQIKQVREMNKKKFEMIRERKKQIEEEKMNKYKEKKEKQKEIEEKKIQQRKEFFNLQQRKLKEQFRLIRTQKEIMAKQNYDQYIQNSKKQESNPAYLQKDKEYMEFEKNFTYEQFDHLVKRILNQDLKRIRKIILATKIRNILFSIPGIKNIYKKRKKR